MRLQQRQGVWNLVSIDIPNFGRLLRQSRHHNMDPQRVLHLSFDDFPTMPRLRHEFHEATRCVGSSLQCMDEAELSQMVAGLGWFFQDRVDIRGVLAGDASAVAQAAIYVVVSKLNDAYFDLREVLTPLRTQLASSVVLEAHPELRGLLDEDGLLPVTDEFVMTDQYLGYRGDCLYYHQLFRRGYRGNVNPHLFYRLAAYHADVPDAVVRVAIDHRRLISQDRYMQFLEKDWWGLENPVDRRYLDDPGAVGHVTVRFPTESDEHRLCDFDMVQALFYLQEGDTKVLEIEEVITADRDGLANLPLVLNRYIHSERDMRGKVFVHLDGAIRTYSRHDYEQRLAGNVADAKAVSERIKVFRIDGPITEDDWSGIVCDFYRGNDLMLAYLHDNGTNLWRR